MAASHSILNKLFCAQKTYVFCTLSHYITKNYGVKGFSLFAEKNRNPNSNPQLSLSYFFRVVLCHIIFNGSVLNSKSHRNIRPRFFRFCNSVIPFFLYFSASVFRNLWQSVFPVRTPCTICPRFGDTSLIFINSRCICISYDWVRAEFTLFQSQCVVILHNAVFHVFLIHTFYC